LLVCLTILIAGHRRKISTWFFFPIIANNFSTFNATSFYRWFFDNIWRQIYFKQNERSPQTLFSIKLATAENRRVLSQMQKKSCVINTEIKVKFTYHLTGTAPWFDFDNKEQQIENFRVELLKTRFAKLIQKLDTENEKCQQRSTGKEAEKSAAEGSQSGKRPHPLKVQILTWKLSSEFFDRATINLMVMLRNDNLNALGRLHWNDNTPFSRSNLCRGVISIVSSLSPSTVSPSFLSISLSHPSSQAEQST